MGVGNKFQEGWEAGNNSNSDKRATRILFFLGLLAFMGMLVVTTR